MTALFRSRAFLRLFDSPEIQRLSVLPFLRPTSDVGPQNHFLAGPCKRLNQFRHSVCLNKARGQIRIFCSYQRHQVHALEQRIPADVAAAESQNSIVGEYNFWEVSKANLLEFCRFLFYKTRSSAFATNVSSLVSIPFLGFCSQPSNR